MADNHGMLVGLRLIVTCVLFLFVGAGHAAPIVWTQAQVAREQVAGAVPGAAEWATVALPHDWEDSFSGYSGIVWYRLKFEHPTGSEGGLWGLYIQRACTNAAVYLNGEQIGGDGLMTDPVTRNCYYPQLANLPRTLLRPGTNEIQIRLVGFAANAVSARQRAAGLSQVQLGPLAEMKALHDRQMFWNVTVAQIIAVTIGLLGMGILGLAAARRKDTYLFYFGLFSTGWAVISTRLFIQNVPFGNLETEILICSVFPPVLASANLFLIRFVERRYKWLDALFLLQILLVPLLLWSAGSGHLLRVASAVYNLLALEFVLSVGFFFWISWRHFRREFWLMCVVLLLAVLLVLLEIALQNDWLPLPKVHVIHFAMPFLFVVIGIRLIQLFVQALNHVELANQVLEQRVAEKSAEIERNYEQLTSLRTAQAAQNERQRIASDLHDDLGAKLLTIVQASSRAQGSQGVAGMAREALEEMRLSVRGITGEPALAANVLADWRAETMTRLAATALVAEWEAGEPAAGLVLPARTHVQLTRVLREAVSNAIRHSGGSRCSVRIAFFPDQIRLEVEDNGCGLPAPASQARSGHGLPNIERRVRKLGGKHVWLRPQGGGTRLQVDVPLQALPMPPSANIDPP